MEEFMTGSEPIEVNGVLVLPEIIPEIECDKTTLLRANPVYLSAEPEEYISQCTNAYVRSIIAEVAALAGAPKDQDCIVVIQGHHMLVNCSSGFVKHINSDDDCITENIYICKTTELDGNEIEILVFADTPEEAREIISKRIPACPYRYAYWNLSNMAAEAELEENGARGVNVPELENIYKLDEDEEPTLNYQLREKCRWIVI